MVGDNLCVSGVFDATSTFPSFTFGDGHSGFVDFRLPSPYKSSKLRGGGCPYVTPLVAHLTYSFPRGCILRARTNGSTSILRPTTCRTLSSIFRLASCSVLSVSPIPPTVGTTPSFNSPTVLQLRFLPPSIRCPPAILLRRPSKFSSPSGRIIFRKRAMSSVLWDSFMSLVLCVFFYSFILSSRVFCRIPGGSRSNNRQRRGIALPSFFQGGRELSRSVHDPTSASLSVWLYEVYSSDVSCATCSGFSPARYVSGVFLASSIPL